MPEGALMSYSPYRVAQKIWHTFLYALYLHQMLTNLQTFFTVRIRRKFVIIAKRSHHTSLHYLVNCRCLKATIENKTSVTTHFKKLTTGNNVFIVSFIV